MTDIAFLQQTSNFIVQIGLGNESLLQTGDLSTAINISGNQITLRELVRLIFAELGIDIEFSGKNEHEKAVVIDMDEDRISELSLNHNALRFGQTVVRANGTITGNLPENEKHQQEENRLGIEELIRQAVHQSLGL